MKKIVVVLVLVFGFVTIQAQERVKKNTYIQNGDRIEAVLYFDNGEISQTGFYTKEGKLTGKWVSYNLQGEKTATAQYDNVTEVDYENSRIAAVNTWKNDGTRVVSNK